MARRFRHGSLVAVGVLLSASLLAAQSKSPEDLAAGKLLVMPRDSPDPSFAESVVLLVHYGPDGAVGLMVNRQTKLPVSRALPDLKGSSKNTSPIYMGGPVEIETVLALVQSRTEPQDATRVFGNVYLVSTKRGLENELAAGTGPGDFRIYLGYCGWASGQLEYEVTRGGWYIFDRNEKLVFDSSPSTVWSRMIARTEQSIARLRGAPHLWPWS